MASQKEKLIAAAQKLVEKGQLDKAIKEYQRVVVEDPNDVRTWLKIGDLYAKLKLGREAAETYQRVAGHYTTQGHLNKAVAVYKQILKIEPRQPEIYLRLGDLYQQLGLTPEAIQQFEALAALYQREGKTKEALLALRQIVELDGENVAPRIKLAELYSKEQMTRQAAEEFKRAADFLHQAQRYEDYLKVAERLLFHQADNIQVTREVARLYIAKGDPRRALPKLQICLKADLRDVEALLLLGQAFEVLGQLEKTISVLRELARVYEENGQRSDRDACHRKILKLRPDDAEARQALSTDPRSGPKRVEAITSQPGVDAAIAAAAAASPPPAAPVAAAPSPTMEAPAPRFVSSGARFLSEQSDEAAARGAHHEEEIGKILTETDVYLKYGLRAKALEHLQKAFALAPNHLVAREKLADLYVKLGRTDEAIETLLLLARQAEGTPQSDGYLREILQLRPAETRARRMLGLADEVSAVELVDYDEQAEWSEGDPAADEGLAGAATEYEDEGAAGADPGYRIEGEATIFGSAGSLLDGVAESVDEVAAAAPEGSLEDDLDEADFFIQQRLFDEARALLRALDHRYPRNPLVSVRFRDLDSLELAAAPGDGHDAVAHYTEAAAAAADEAGGDEIAALPVDWGEAQAPEETRIAGSVFPTFAGEKTVTGEDFDTHYDLGVAYKEMGLVDDAITEFNIVMQDPTREVQCHLMLGLCFAEKGLITDAITQYKEGLYAEQLQEREQITLYYELGRTYEKLSDAREALYYYEKVWKRDQGFRDIERRMVALRGESVVSGLPSPEDGDDYAQSFDGPPITEAGGK